MKPKKARHISRSDKPSCKIYPLAISMLALCSAFLAIAVSTQSAIAQQSSNTYKIGLSVPLSGSANKLAIQFIEGAKLALQQQNGKNQQRFELIISDDACDDQIAKLAADELIEAKVDLITGLLCNSATIEIANKTQQSGIPLLVAGARSERIMKDRKRNEWNIWRLTPGDDDGARMAAQTLAKTWAGKAYAIVDDGTVYGRNLADGFRALMEEAGLPPQFQDNFRPTQSTQARLVRRLQRAGITHVFVAAAAEDIALVAKNAADLAIPLEIAGGDALSILPYFPTEDLPPNGIVAFLETAALPSQLSKEFSALLEANNMPPEPYVLRGYQAVQIAVEAIQLTHRATTYAIATGNFETILGPVKFDSEGKNTARQYGVYVWQNNQFQQVTQ